MLIFIVHCSNSVIKIQRYFYSSRAHGLAIFLNKTLPSVSQPCWYAGIT